MKPEERLFDLIGNLPDDLTCQTDVPKKTRRKITPKTRNRWIGLGVAACLVVAFVGWGMTYTPPYMRDDFPTNSHNLAAPGPKLEWPKVSDNSFESALYSTNLPVSDRMAIYTKVENPRGISTEQRPKYLGEAYLDMNDWYLIYGSSGLRYLVHAEDDGSYTLWEFSHFTVYDEETLARLEESVAQGELTHLAEFINGGKDFSPYPYSEVLETIYGVTSADDLVSVTVEPSKADNTDAGKKLQKQIGTHTVTDRDSLSALYNALVSMTCYGADNWDMIDLGTDDEEGGMLHSVALSRYLTIELTNGSTIDTLKYTANSGRFYEFSGIAYSPLDTETAAQMNEIFHIEP